MFIKSIKLADMKRMTFLLSLFTALLFIMPEATSQAPMSFSFQAVARSSSGELIADSNLDVRLSLYSVTDASLIWQETHSVNTSDLGLFIAEVGSGTRTGGSALEFGDIDWSADRYYLKVELDEGSGWEDMGSSDLLSVPYALNAASVSNIKSLKVNEKEDNPPDSALFEVKNNTGNTVFAVYNEGVRVFVDDNQGKSKGPKGGFAIGGFDNAKGETFEFFRVTPDSVRIYLDEGTTKGNKGGFAIGGFDRAKGLTEDIMHMSEDNYFIGYESGSNITTGLYNSFFGYQAGLMNTEGNNNVFMGNQTGYSNTTGNWNIYLGNYVGWHNSVGYSNVILGDGAGEFNTEGSMNVILGDWAGRNNTTGENNVYLGARSGYNSGETQYNVMIGAYSGYSNTDGWYNVFVGENSGYSNISGVSNVFLGKEAGYYNSDGSYNVFLGTWSGHENTSGTGNVYLGQQAGEKNSTGSYNVSLGDLSGRNSIEGDSCVFIGYLAGYNESQSNRFYLDNDQDETFSAFMYGEFDNDLLSFYANTYIWGTIHTTDVYANNYYYNKGISESLNNILDDVLTLNPFEYSIDDSKSLLPEGPARNQIGIAAEEIESVFPWLVRKNVKGEKGINYSRFSVVLLQAIKEQQQIIDDQEERLMELEAKVEMLMNK